MVCPRIPTLALFAVLSPACTPHREAPPPAAVAAPVEAVPREPVTIEVLAEWPGQGVIEIERSLLVPLERALQGVPQATRIDGSARPGRATVVLTLDPSADPGLCRVEVHERLGAASSSLPEHVVPVIAAELAAPEQALVFALSPTTADSMQLQRAARELREALYVIPGVGAVETCGGREPRLVVAVDPARLSAYRLSIPAVVRALTRSLSEEPRLPAGVLTLTATRSIDELMAVLLAQGERPVALRDVASVAVEPVVGECDAARIGGGPVILGLVRARRGAGLPALESAVRAELAARRSEFAARGVTLEVLAASPPRFLLDLWVRSDPDETAAETNRRIAAELAALGPDVAAQRGYLRVMMAPTTEEDLEGELLLESTGLAAAELAMLAQRIDAPGLRVQGQRGDPSLLRFRITGDDLEANQRLAREAAEIAAAVPGVVRAVAPDHLGVGYAAGIKRERLAWFGLSASELLVSLAAALDGTPAGSVQMDGARMPVVVRVGSVSRGHPEPLAVLEALEIDLPAGGKVRLAELVDIEIGVEPAKISRVDGRRATQVAVTVADPTPEQRSRLQQALAASLQLPPGHTLVWDQASRSKARSSGSHE